MKKKIKKTKETGNTSKCLSLSDYLYRKDGLPVTLSCACPKRSGPQIKAFLQNEVRSKFILLVSTGAESWRGQSAELLTKGCITSGKIRVSSESSVRSERPCECEVGHPQVDDPYSRGWWEFKFTISPQMRNR